MRNIVSIDPSLQSTAIVINGRVTSFAEESLIFTKKGDYTKWFEVCSKACDIVPIKNYTSNQTFTDSEVNKLRNYRTTAQAISDYLQSKVDKSLPTEVFIEGYSYSSADGALIDLVTFSTLLRSACDSLGYILHIIPPSSLKSFSASLTYAPEKKGKKTIYRNYLGVPGGKFKKPEMMYCIVENPKFDDDWARLMKSVSAEVLAMKSIPKPIDDLNDAYLLYQCALSGVIGTP